VEQLDPSDKERIKKMSEESIKKYMEREGWTPEQLRGVPLAKLKDALAQHWVERREEELRGAVGGGVGLQEADELAEGVKEENETVEIVRMKLEVERERIALERDQEREKIALEKEKMHMEERKLQAELEIKRLELEQMAGFKKDKLKILQARNDEEKKRMESKVYQAKLFSDALRGTMPRMPSDPIEMMAYFQTVEKLFVDFEVKEALKVHLLKPHLTEQARVLVAKMDPAKCSDYDEVKKLLLHEFKLSPSALLEKFNSLERNANETYTLFGNRLMSVLTYYVENRNAKSHEQLMQLLVCDRIKSKLSQAALQHVMSLEHKADDGWLKLSALLEAIDLFYDTHLSTDKPRAVQSAVSKVSDSVSETSSFTKMDKPAKRCYKCGSYKHLAAYHEKPLLHTSGNNASARGAGFVNEGESHSVNASVNACITTSGDQVSGDAETRSSPASEPLPEIYVGTAGVGRVEVLSRSSSENSAIDSQGALANDSRGQAAQAGGLAQVAQVNKVDGGLNLSSPFASLSYLPVVLSDIEGNCCTLSGLSDSGAEVALANTSVITDLHPVDIGSVKIKGVIGEPISVPLVSLNVASADKPERVVSFACAITDQANNPLILTADIVRKLMPQVEQSFECNVVGCEDNDDDNDDSDEMTDSDSQLTVGNRDNDDNNDNTSVTNDQSVSDVSHSIDAGLCSSIPGSEASSSTPDSIVSCPVGSISDVPGNAEAAALKFEQLADKTLLGCFSLAKRNKGRFYFKNGVLHRVDVVVGQTVEQLVCQKIVDSRLLI